MKLERVIAMGVGLKKEPITEIKENLLELEELIDAAGGEVVATTMQHLEKYIPATLIGSGKVEEIKSLIQETEATTVVIDHQLSGGQMRNLETELKVKVLDRTQLILDIFAQRAQTYEGKLQVELAQLLDQYPRMVGGWLGSLSRLGGGIGTRGPGETALELDRRKVREKMDKLRERLEIVAKNRGQRRRQRERAQIPSFALIGYTNVGKSLLLNRLSNSDTFVKDQVFATLDPITRQIHLPNGTPAVVTDTVGFIRKLPTQLIEAFKATLEESSGADVLIHVVDISSDKMEQHIETVDQLILELGWNEKPIIHVFNKMDKADIQRQVKISKPNRVFISALTGEGLDRLKNLMIQTLDAQNRPYEFYFESGQEDLIFQLGRDGQILKKETSPLGSVVVAKLTPLQLNRWRGFLSR